MTAGNLLFLSRFSFALWQTGTKLARCFCGCCSSRWTYTSYVIVLLGLVYTLGCRSCSVVVPLYKLLSHRTMLFGRLGSSIASLVESHRIEGVGKSQILNRR